jgi:uncharacterized membrane protein
MLKEVSLLDRQVVTYGDTTILLTALSLLDTHADFGVFLVYISCMIVFTFGPSLDTTTSCISPSHPLT